MSRNFTRTFISLAAVAALGFTACSSDDAAGDTAGGTSSSGEKILVGAAPIGHFYTARIAEAEGFFEEEGINVELTDVTSASQQVALMESGNLDIGGSGPAELLTAASEGLSIKMLPFSDTSSADPAEALRGIVVDPEKGFDDVANLEGETVAVSNALNSPHLDTLGTLSSLGVDYDAVTFIEIPSGQHWESLQNGDIAAAVMTDPSLSAAVAGGAEVIEVPEKSGNILSFTWFTNDDFVADRPEDAQAFLRAMARAAELIESDPSVLRDMAAEQGLDATVAEQMRIPTYQTTLEASDLQPMADLLFEFNIVDEALDPSIVLTDITAE